MAATIRLGDREFPVVAQKHARLRHLLGRADLGELFSSDYGPGCYRALCIFVPAISRGVPHLDGREGFANPPMPVWEFCGYTSEKAWKKDDWDEESDPGPDTAQMARAINVAVFEVSGLKSLGITGIAGIGRVLGMIQDAGLMKSAAVKEAVEQMAGPPAQAPVGSEPPVTLTPPDSPGSTGA